MASRATVATQLLFLRSGQNAKICLLGRSPLPLRSVLVVRHRRTAPPNPASGQLGSKLEHVIITFQKNEIPLFGRAVEVVGCSPFLL